MTVPHGALKGGLLGPLLLCLDSDDVARMESLTEASKAAAVERFNRLLSEGYAEKVAALLCAGRLPEDKRKWPPTPRYRLGNGGPEEEERVREWMMEWFERNHEVK